MKIELENKSLIVKTVVKLDYTNTQWFFGKDVSGIEKLAMFGIMKNQIDKEIRKMLG